MARHNRPRRRDGEYEPLDMERLGAGLRRTEGRGTQEWTVQSISALNSTKSYQCPGCGLEVSPGVSHVVAWRADGILGDEADLAARRHWHDRCWKIG
jgi:hypothetical protein